MTTTTTLTGVFRPATKVGAWVYDAILVVFFSAVVALASQVSIPLPFTPVPLTLQTLAVLLTGMALGSRRGAIAMILYLGEGAAGLPVFAAGKASLAYMMGPTGGYLLGFVVAAFVVGLLAERRWDRWVAGTAAAMVVGNLVIYAFGLGWLSRFVPAERLLAAGMIPFLAGDALKIAVATGLLPLAWKLVGGRARRS